LGTFLATLSNLGNFGYNLWLETMDALLVKKGDEEYDEVFGIVKGLS
jgi:hypothetical protein